MRSKSPSSSQPRAEELPPRRGLTAGVNRSTLLWSLGFGVIVALFMTAPVRDVYFNHFNSWEISDRPSTTTLAKLLRSLAAPAVIVTFLGAVVSGAIALLHIRDDDSGPEAWATAAGRIVVAFGLSIAIEWSASGVQDGSSRDVDLVPTHSVVILVIAIAAPWLFAGADLAIQRRRS